MKLTTLYVNLRRFNALLPSLFILVVVLAIGWAALSQKNQNTTKTVVPPGEDTANKGLVLELRLLDFSLGENQILMEVVGRSQANSGPGYEKGRGIRNLVFVNENSESVKWLFPSQAQEITRVQPLKFPSEVVIGVYLEVFENMEKENRSYETRSVYLTSNDGLKSKKVLSDVDFVMSKRIHEQKLRVIYEKENSVRLAQIDMQDFRVVADRELAKMTELKE